VKRSHSWFPRSAEPIWSAHPARSLLCIVPTGCGNGGFASFAERWIIENFQSPREQTNSSILLLPIVPDQSTSASRLIERLRRSAERQLGHKLPRDIDGDPISAFEDLVLDIHSYNIHPIMLIDRFQSFARMANDEIIALLSQMRTFEQNLQLTTIAISSISYNLIRQALPADLAFVNSSYGDNHDHIIMPPLSLSEFSEDCTWDQSTRRKLFEMGGGPDCVYQTVLDEAHKGLDGLKDRCVARVSTTVLQFLRELDPQNTTILETLEQIRQNKFSLPKISYLRANPLFSYVVKEERLERLSLKGEIMSEVVRMSKSTRQIPEKDLSLKILIVSANPDFDLDLERELQSIRDLADTAPSRSIIEINCILGATPDSFLQALRRYNPNVVHFSGHGSTSGILMRGDGTETHQVSGRALARTLKLRNVEMVVLNACYSSTYADEISKSVNIVVGTTDAVDDEAALRFSKAFYRTIFLGYSVEDALQDGMAAVELYDLPNVYQSCGNISTKLLLSN
jgi:hypothetical protein